MQLWRKRLFMPTPIVISLADTQGFQLRQKAAEYIAANLNRTGAERGSSEEQGFGALAEIVVRRNIGMPEINPEDHPLGYDVLLPSGVKVDVKCRSGTKPFKETYESNDGIVREAKHNFFARQVYDPTLDADIYLMAHLRTPAKRTLPGTNRQRSWVLFICGWASKERVKRDGVYLPRGSLTEQGNTWFPYRGQEIEFYHRNLIELKDIKNLLCITRDDVASDISRPGDLHLTSADAIRIAYDLVGRGILTPAHLIRIQEIISLAKSPKPILHSNQYFHLLKWLAWKGIITEQEIERARAVLQEEPFTGI